MKKTFFLLLTCSLLLAAACTSEDDMTPSTEDAHSTLRCKINGEDWEPKGGDLFTSKPYRLEYYDYDGFFVFDASNTTSDSALRGTIMLSLTNTELGVNRIKDIEDIWYISNSDNISECKYYEELNSQVDNEITIIEIDTINYFIKAEFNFSVINNCQDTINVTEGYFDLNYRF